MSETKPNPVEDMVDSWLSSEQTTPEGNQQETQTDEQATPDADPNAGNTEDQRTEQSPQGSQDGQKPDGQPAKPSDNAQRDAQQAQKPRPGDLVDGQGRVLARAGAERRHYETAQRATRELGTVRQQLERTSAELNAFREAAQLPQQLGLSVEDTTTGLQLVASWKQNPVGVINYLVEQAKAAGHNVEGFGGATDVGAIKSMIANELAPFRQQADQQRAQQQAHTQAQQQVNSLVTEYGESALANSEALAKLIDAAQAQGKTLNLEQAYLRFSNWCLQNGFDPGQNIDQQIAARQQPNGQAPATQQSHAGPPRPQGGRPAAAPNSAVPMDPTAGTTGNESMRDLVRASMREAGFNV